MNKPFYFVLMILLRVGKADSAANHTMGLLNENLFHKSF